MSLTELSQDLLSTVDGHRPVWHSTSFSFSAVTSAHAHLNAFVKLRLFHEWWCLDSPLWREQRLHISTWEKIGLAKQKAKKGGGKTKKTFWEHHTHVSGAKKQLASHESNRFPSAVFGPGKPTSQFWSQSLQQRHKPDKALILQTWINGKCYAVKQFTEIPWVCDTSSLVMFDH